MAKGQKSQLVTKKHLARQQRERLQNRYILFVSIGVIIIAVGLIGYGIIQQYVLQPQQPVAKVGTSAITTKQFQTFARYERLQFIQQYQQYQQFAQLFGSDPNSLNYIQQTLSQIEYQLQPTSVGQTALDYLIANVLIQQEAEKRGITVSDAEITDALQNYFGYYANGTPTTAATTVPIPTSTLNPTQLVLVPPTVTPLPTATETSTPVITTTATQETTSPTPTSNSTPTAGPTSTPLPTATPYTFQAYQKDVATYMADIHTFAGLNEADFRWIFGMQQLRKKVMDAITADAAREQDQVWARHIVVSDQAKAQSVYNRLANGGDFKVIATEVMTGTTTTVDLGWFGTGTLVAAAEKVVFNTQIGQITEPIQTPNGWEIYQVLGHEVRPLTDAQYTTLKQTDFQNWIDQQKASENVQTFDLWKTRVPTSPTIPPTQTGK